MKKLFLILLFVASVFNYRPQPKIKTNIYLKVVGGVVYGSNELMELNKVERDSIINNSFVLFN